MKKDNVNTVVFGTMNLFHFKTRLFSFETSQLSLPCAHGQARSLGSTFLKSWSRILHAISISCMIIILHKIISIININAGLEWSLSGLSSESNKRTSHKDMQAN